MDVREAMQLIDAEVAAGACVSIRDFLGFAEITLRTVPVNGAIANPRCTARTQEDAIISIGQLLARWRREY